jgi:hypothetical protein
MSWWRNLWKRRPSHLDVEETKTAAMAVIDRFDGGGMSDDEFGDAARNALRRIGDDVELMKELMKGLPEGAMRGDVWVGGVVLASLARGLAERLRERELGVVEELGWRLHAHVTCHVQGHYHHLVGPAMLAHADCLERLAKTTEALDDYRAVIYDFVGLVEEYAAEEGPLFDEQRTAIESLKTALERHVALGGAPLERIDIAAAQSRIASLLQRPAPTD